MNINNFMFDPASITIKVGTTVTWTNQESATHSVVASDGSWESPSLNTGDTFSHTFDKAGTFEYVCGFHSRMMGTVIVE